MTDIEFHVNLPHKLEFSCRLLRKAFRSGAKAIVVADPPTLAQLDRLLWEFSSTEFLPHCMASGPELTTARTPILLVDQLEQHAEHAPGSILINLGQHVPEKFERFERFIEIASAESQDRLAALARWKHYKSRGYPLKQHNAANSGANG